MGWGYQFKCEKCGTEYHAYMGQGYIAAYCVYCCRNCNYWVSEEPTKVKMCPKCRKRMHRANDEEARMLPCPKCGNAAKPEDAGYLRWD